jgi:hypothetical protein
MNPLHLWLTSQSKPAKTEIDWQNRNLVKESLTAKEEEVAKHMKSALPKMKEQYGEKKGENVFYGTVKKQAAETKEEEEE